MHTMKFIYGFTYKNVRYGWLKKRLFRLPFQSKLRNYGLKEIEPIKCGKVYNIQRKQLTIKRLEAMTTDVNWSVDVVVSEHCPF